ncbi:MAG: phosphatidylglycerophosphatase A [Ignavibacteria bacterium]|nr:phosphatidylglycerophosphatase A [Ignavibacteria bacterium]
MGIIKKKQILDTNIKVNFFSLLFNSFFFIGFVPVASGTVASIFALVPLVIPEFNNVAVIFLVTIIFFIISLLSAKNILRKYGDDPSIFVMDEVIGMWITAIIIKIIFEDTILLHIFIGFLFFRFFDIIKIQPAKYFDGLKNTFGVLMDDIVSGIYAGFSSSILIYIIKLIW